MGPSGKPRASATEMPPLMPPQISVTGASRPRSSTGRRSASGVSTDTVRAPIIKGIASNPSSSGADQPQCQDFKPDKQNSTALSMASISDQNFKR